MFGRKTATESLFAWHGLLRVWRLVVRDTPAHAVDVAVGHLLMVDFRPDPLDLETPLRAEGSEWTARTVEIGDEVAVIARDFVNEVVAPVLRPAVPPTMVVVCARALDDGTCELVIAPQAVYGTTTGDRELANPRIARGATAVIAAYEAVGGMLETETVRTMIRDVTCPAFPKRFRALVKAQRKAQRFATGSDPVQE